jgi:hypothetical protein
MSYRYANLPIEQVRANAKNTRTHSKKQIRQIAASIRELGFAAPVLVDEYDVLIAGHGRLEAARSLGMASIPAIVLDDLSEAKKRALMLADNRIAQSAGWDREQLSIELAALPELLIEEGIDVASPVSNQPRSISCTWTLRMGQAIRVRTSPTIASAAPVSRKLATSGALANIVCSAAMHEVRAISSDYWVPSAPIWHFSILLTMWRSEVSSDGARRSTGSLRWRPARCPATNSPTF